MTNIDLHSIAPLELKRQRSFAQAFLLNLIIPLMILSDMALYKIYSFPTCQMDLLSKIVGCWKFEDENTRSCLNTQTTLVIDTILDYKSYSPYLLSGDL